jgi:hypothetical protein
MNRNKKLEGAAERLLDIFERSAENLSAPERDAKWRAFNRVMAKVGSRAKSQAKPRTLSTFAQAKSAHRFNEFFLGRNLKLVSENPLVFQRVLFALPNVEVRVHGGLPL